MRAPPFPAFKYNKLESERPYLPIRQNTNPAPYKPKVIIKCDTAAKLYLILHKKGMISPTAADSRNNFRKLFYSVKLKGTVMPEMGARSRFSNPVRKRVRKVRKQVRTENIGQCREVSGMRAHIQT